MKALALAALVALGLSLGSAEAAAPVTREEAAAVLAGIDAAHAREDQKAVESAYRGALGVGAGQAARDLFKDRNRLDLVQRIESAREDGEALETEVLVTLRSRRVSEPSDRVEKRRLG